MGINGKCNTLRVGGKSSQSDKHNFDIIKLDKQLNIKPTQDKASCFTAGGNSGGNHSDMDLICIKQLPRGANKGGLFHDKSPTLTSNSFEHNNHVIACDFRHDEGIRFKKDGKSGTLLGRARNDESCGQLAYIDYKIRRLTPTECARLQTIPEWYEWIVSETQQYKLLGNGWNIETVKHIFKFMK